MGSEGICIFTSYILILCSSMCSFVVLVCIELQHCSKPSTCTAAWCPY